jgi:hypothetical protein
MVNNKKLNQKIMKPETNRRNFIKNNNSSWGRCLDGANAV